MNKPHIFVVGDNPSDLELLAMALDQQNEPYNLIGLVDGVEALAFLRRIHNGSQDPPPCVILLDVHLPKLDGLDVLAVFRREPALRHIPIVMLASGAVRPEDELRIRNLDAEFREKPRHFSEVLKLAADALDLCKKLVA